MKVNILLTGLFFVSITSNATVVYSGSIEANSYTATDFNLQSDEFGDSGFDSYGYINNDGYVTTGNQPITYISLEKTVADSIGSASAWGASDASSGTLKGLTFSSIDSYSESINEESYSSSVSTLYYYGLNLQVDNDNTTIDFQMLVDGTISGVGGYDFGMNLEINGNRHLRGFGAQSQSNPLGRMERNGDHLFNSGVESGLSYSSEVDYNSFLVNFEDLFSYSVVLNRGSYEIDLAINLRTDAVAGGIFGENAIESSADLSHTATLGLFSSDKAQLTTPGYEGETVTNFV